MGRIQVERSPAEARELFEAARECRGRPALATRRISATCRDDYVSEINLAAGHFMISLGGILKTGAIC